MIGRDSSFLGYFNDEYGTIVGPGYLTQDGQKFVMELSITNAGRIYLVYGNSK